MDVEKLKEYAYGIAYETMDYRRTGCHRLEVTVYAKVNETLEKAKANGCYSDILAEVERGYKDAKMVNDMIDRAREALQK